MPDGSSPPASHIHPTTSMTNRSSSLPLLFLASCLCAGSCSAFAVGGTANIKLGRKPRSPSSLTNRCFTSNGEARAKCTKRIAICSFQNKNGGWDDSMSQWSRRRIRMLANQSDNEEEPMQIVGLGDDTLPDKTWEDIEAGAPSELSIMKEVSCFRSWIDCVRFHTIPVVWSKHIHTMSHVNITPFPYCIALDDRDVGGFSSLGSTYSHIFLARRAYSFCR